MSNTISIKNMDKAAVLAVLYNNSQPLGINILHYDPTPMTIDEAKTLLQQTTRFDYLKDRVMKIDLSGDELLTSLYDRDLGEGAAARAIASIK